MSTLRDTIKAAQDIDMKEVHIPEWGVDVYIKQLTRGQQDEFLRRQFGKVAVESGNQTQKVGSMSMYGHDAWICVMAVCDSEGNKVFSSSDEKMLKEKNGAVVGRLAVEIIEFSDMAADVEAMDAEVKN